MQLANEFQTIELGEQRLNRRAVLPAEPQSEYPQCLPQLGRNGCDLPLFIQQAGQLRHPEGVKPVQWRLLTNREANTLEKASELIDWYRARWEIELFLLILKQGWRGERLQLGTKTCWSRREPFT